MQSAGCALRRGHGGPAARALPIWSLTLGSRSEVSCVRYASYAGHMKTQFAQSPLDVHAGSVRLHMARNVETPCQPSGIPYSMDWPDLTSIA